MNIILLHQVIHSCSRADDWHEADRGDWEKEAFSYPVETLSDLKQRDGLTKIQANLRYASKATENHLPLFNAMLEDLGNNGKTPYTSAVEPLFPASKIGVSAIDHAYVCLSTANHHLKQAALFYAREGMMGLSALCMKLWQETLRPLLFITTEANAMALIEGGVVARPRTEAKP